MNKSSLFLVLGLGFLSYSCALFSPKQASTGTAFDNYTEDLSVNRITFTDLDKVQLSTPERVDMSSTGNLAVDSDLAIAVQRNIDKNRSERTWNGFTVLVYSGVDRDQAFKTRNELFTLFPDLKPDLQYQQPRYLLKVGKFLNRIEAQAPYYQLKEKFPMARIIQDRFQREGYVNPDPIDDGERPNQVTGGRL
ncbi:hypothetical protein [Mongoliitalea daihaiensis]|uniref:hypothetical protein n=1 Tax=Mongoliitalea daihaiensis TaxID=2782006 RepID=UPI001F2BC085|nr:hypothetical protein [Mongoliitalea daihaiensis]UJP65713.1 hypothetical protein IPZ59_03555 [Mongoliitalea daihaiensis]